MDEDRTPTGEKSTCGMYVVGLIDLLNQGKQLDEWGSHPHTPAEESDFKGALKRTVGQVHAFREAFKGFAESYRTGPETHARWATISDKQKAEVQRLADFQLGCQNFSDTVVLYSRLAIAGGDTTVLGLHGMLLASASVLLPWLAKGIPLRGGIEVGMAIDFFPDEIYGPVLRRAYLLEQNLAQYPRVVVGPAAIAYLRHCITASSENAATKLNSAMAKNCLRLITLDQDGAHFVDFLSDYVHELYLDAADYRKEVAEGHAFAKREHEHFVEEGDHKLALRYAWLRQYYESRM